MTLWTPISQLTGRKGMAAIVNRHPNRLSYPTEIIHRSVEKKLGYKRRLATEIRTRVRTQPHVSRPKSQGCLVISGQRRSPPSLDLQAINLSEDTLATRKTFVNQCDADPLRDLDCDQSCPPPSRSRSPR